MQEQNQHFKNLIGKMEGAIEKKLNPEWQFQGLLNRFEGCIRTLEGMAVSSKPPCQGGQQAPSQSTQQQSQPQQASQGVAQSSKLPSFQDFFDKIKIAEELLKTVDKEVADMSLIIIAVAHKIQRVILASETMKKPTQEQLQKISQLFKEDKDKLDAFSRSKQYFDHYKAFSDLLLSGLCVFSDLPQETLQSQIDSAEFFALKFKKNKDQVINGQYNSIADIFKSFVTWFKINFKNKPLKFSDTDVKTFEENVKFINGGAAVQKTEETKTQPKEEKKVEAKPAQKTVVKKEPKKYFQGPPNRQNLFIENYENNAIVTVEENELRIQQQAFISNCNKTTVCVRPKCNSIVIQNCVSCNFQISSVICAVELINCKKTNIEIINSAKSITVDRSSDINILLPREPENSDDTIISTHSDTVNISFKINEEDESKPSIIPNQIVTKYDPAQKMFVSTIYEHAAD